MDIKSVEKVVSKIQSNIFKRANSHSIGMLKSHFKGSGLQFKEHQVYSHGDEVRFIDWRMLAKTNVPYIKTFEEERNVEIVVVIDLAPNMLVGYKGISKLQASLEIACLLFLLAKETNDKVHILLIGQEIHSLPSSSGRQGVVQLISKLESIGVLDKDGRVLPNFDKEYEINYQKNLSAILQNLVKSREIILLSDFVNFLDEQGIKRIIHRSNLHCFKMTSPLDRRDHEKFVVFGYAIGKSKGEFLQVGASKEFDDNLSKLLGKKLQRLDVDTRYLDEFITKMM